MNEFVIFHRNVTFYAGWPTVKVVEIASCLSELYWDKIVIFLRLSV